MDGDKPSPLIGALLDIRTSGGHSAGPHHASQPEAAQPQAPPTQAAEHQAPPSTPAQRLPIPSAWRILFHSKHADAEVYSGLFQACRAGIRVALREVPKLTVHYRRCSSNYSEHREFRNIDAVHRALAVRGRQRLPCALVVHASSQWPSLAELTHAVLGDACRGVVELRLCRSDSLYTGSPDAEKAALLLLLAAGILPNLTTLHVSLLNTTLPPPSSLKKLTSLTLQLSGWGYSTPADEQVCDSLQPLLPQLTQLVILTEARSQKEVAWELVFPAPTTSTATQRTPYTNLTHLTTDARLTHALIGMLLEHVPVLNHLSVGHVRLGPPYVDWDGNVEPIHSHEEWGLESLCVTREGIAAEQLCYLPRKSGEGRTIVRATEGRVYLAARHEDTPGLNPELRSRLHEWQFVANAVVVGTMRNAAEHPAVLPAVLSQLQSLQAPAATLHLVGWQWHTEAQPAVAASLPTLPFSQVKLSLTQPLTDGMLSLLIDIAPHVRKLNVPSLDLQSDQHTNTPWPWDELTIDTVAVACLPLLPNPRGGGEAGRYVAFGTLDFTRITEAHVPTLTDWLPHVTWHPHPSTFSNPMICLGHAPRFFNASPPPPPALPPHAALRAQLSLLPALRLPIEPDPVSGHSFGWTPEPEDVLCGCINAPMAQEVMQCLQDLPPWPVRLSFESIDWPLAHTEYAQLAQYVPTEYTRWWLPGQSNVAGGGYEDFPWARMKQICAGIDARRGALKPQGPADTDSDSNSSGGAGMGAECDPQECDLQSPADADRVAGSSGAQCEPQSPAAQDSSAWGWYGSEYEGPLPLRLVVGAQQSENAGMGQHVMVWGVCDKPVGVTCIAEPWPWEEDEENLVINEQ